MTVGLGSSLLTVALWARINPPSWSGDPDLATGGTLLALFVCWATVSLASTAFAAKR